MGWEGVGLRGKSCEGKYLMGDAIELSGLHSLILLILHVVSSRKYISQIRCVQLICLCFLHYLQVCNSSVTVPKTRVSSPLEFQVTLISRQQEKHRKSAKLA